MYVFDIETGGQDKDKIRKFFQPVIKPPKPFEPATVKYGNIKDEVKRAEKLQAAKASHEAQCETAVAAAQLAEEQFFDKAALYAHLGEVLCIGIGDLETDKVELHAYGCDLEMAEAPYLLRKHPSEADLICYFWSRVEQAIVAAKSMAGFNSFGFDLPFLCRRSWLLGIDLPQKLIHRSGRYTNWNPWFIDLMHTWGCGESFPIDLDTLARAMGLPGKVGGIDGGMFAELYRSGVTADVLKALDYAAGDIVTTMGVAKRLQLV